MLPEIRGGRSLDMIAELVTYIQEALEKQVIDLACRHNMHEVIMAKIVQSSIGHTFGSEIRIFKIISSTDLI